MKRKIKIYFTDFWPVFDIYDNYFTKLLSERYDLEVTTENPDFLIYSVFGTEYLRYNCPRIFYTGENVRPNFQECDWAFTFDLTDNTRHYRLPLYPIFGNVMDLVSSKPDPEKLLKEKKYFCNFIYSNAGPKLRRDFFYELSKYKKVDSAGRLFRNTDRRINNKLDFIKDYKFTIAFENESYPGYTTEKIFEPMLVNSIPIYWGNPNVDLDFNPESFINYHELGSIDAVIDKVKELDNDDNKYMEMLSKPFLKNNVLNEFVKKENILNQFDKIFNSDIIPLGKQKNHSKLYFFQRDILFKVNAYKDKIKNFNFHKIKVKWIRYTEKRNQ
jgi:hypothetical protein